MNASAVASKPFYSRVALLGFALYLGLVLTYIVVSLIAGNTGDATFSVIVGIPAIVAVALILRFGSWALVVASLLAIVGILFFAPSIPVGLTTPDSFFDFITATVGVAGLVIALVGCVVSFFQQRSGHAAATGSPTAVLAIRGVLALILVTGIISAVLTVANKETVSAADKEGATVVTANKSEWNTDTIDAASSGTLQLLLKNSDPYLHTFTVKDLNMDFKLKPGSEKLIVLKNPKAGSHEFICTLHTDMKGTVNVR